MSDNTELNPGYGGDIYAADDVNGIKFQRVKLVHGADGVNDGDVSTGNGLPVAPQNVLTEFRESFEAYDTTNVWSQSVASGDIVQLDGNAVSASYLMISKDPLTAGTETIVETRASFTGPLETAVGLHMSQRVLGQECSIELVSTDTPLPSVADMALSSMGSNGTMLYISTVNPHGLTSGQRFGLYGITSDSRMNYPSLVVFSVISPTQIYAQAGPGGTIPSLTVGPYNNQGYLYVRPAMNYAQEGASQIFENTSTTNASAYVRSDAGDALPSGVASGNHSINTGSTSSNQLIAASYTYAFNPSNEYKFQLQADRVQFLDYAVDGTAAITTRLTRTSVVPSLAKAYKLRFRITNNKGLTVPTAKIVSQSKAGSTTATVTTAAAHGLTTGDYVVLIGTRDVTNFLQAGAAVQVLSTPTSTTFTVAYSTSVTATSYGGLVARVQGGNIPSSLGTAALVSAQSAYTAGLSNELQIVGSGNWSTTVGDYVNVYGLRDNTTGADLGVDGVYKVVDVATTTIRLAPVGGVTLPSFTTTNCGGTIIKRTDVRISYARIFQYLRERVEMPSRTDGFSSIPVYLNSGVSLNAGSNVIGYTAPNTYNALTSTSLGASATYTGATTNLAASTTSTTVYTAAVAVSVQHLAGLTPGTLVYEVGYENSSTTPTTWYPLYTVPVPSNSSWQTFTFPAVTRYYRVRFINGATAQSSFRLATQHISNGALGADLTFPRYLLIPLSNTTIGANGVQTQATLDFGDANRIYKTISATVYTDQPSATNGFQLQVSRDNSNWRVAAQTTVTGGVLATISTDLVYRYARVVYTNGATINTTFACDCQAGV